MAAAILIVVYCWYLYIIDIIDTKLYKPPPNSPKKKRPENILPLKFINKGMEHINLSEILNLPDVVQSLPISLQTEENVPNVVMKLTSPIRSSIMNYEETVRSIHFEKDEGVSFFVDSTSGAPYPCSCSESEFCDPHHKHIVTGNLRVVENQKLRKLLTKGPNYREPITINFGKCRAEIEKAVVECAASLSEKYKLPLSSFDDWIKNIKKKTLEKVRSLRLKVVPQKTKPVLEDEDVKRYLAEFHKKYVVVPIDKAANNISIICKRFYVFKLLKEIGALETDSKIIFPTKIGMKL